MWLKRGFYYSDAPANVAGGGGPPAVSPIDAGAASPPAAAPIPPPPTPAVAPPVAPPVAPAKTASEQGFSDADPNQLFEVEVAGQRQIVTLQTMADSLNKPQVDATSDEIKTGVLFTKAAAGDMDAHRQLVEMYAPAGQAPAPVGAEGQPAAVGDQATLQRIQELEAKVAQGASTVEEFTTARGVAQFNALNQHSKEQLPYLAQHPNGAQLAYTEYLRLKDAAVSAGHDIDRNDTKKLRVIGAAMTSINNRIQAEHSTYAGMTIPANGAQAAAPAATHAVDDQGLRPATQLPMNAVGMLNGIPVDQWGRPIPIASPAMANPTIPGAPVAPVAASGTPLGEAGPNPQQPMTQAQFSQYLKVRSAEVTQAQ